MGQGTTARAQGTSPLGRYLPSFVAPGSASSTKPPGGAGSAVLSQQGELGKLFPSFCWSLRALRTFGPDKIRCIARDKTFECVTQYRQPTSDIAANFSLPPPAPEPFVEPKMPSRFCQELCFMLGELLCQNRYMKYLTKLKSILYSKPNHLVENININGVLMVAGCNSFGGRRGTCTKPKT